MKTREIITGSYEEGFDKIFSCQLLDKLIPSQSGYMVFYIEHKDYSSVIYLPYTEFTSYKGALKIKSLMKNGRIKNISISKQFMRDYHIIYRHSYIIYDEGAA